MLDFLIAPEMMPFSVALLVMLMIGLVEAIGLGAGAVQLGGDADAQMGGDLLGWLGVGKVPLLIVLVVLLALFGLIGIAMQSTLASLSGAAAPLWIAAPAALAAALPLTGLGARALARIMPGDETSAVGLDDLIGRRATVTIGTARKGAPARASVRDRHGQTHYVMIEPSHEAVAIAEGESALLVGRDGDLFEALAEGAPLEPSFAPRALLPR